MREDSLRSLSSSAVLATALGDPKHRPVGGSKHGRSKFIPFPCLYLVRRYQPQPHFYDRDWPDFRQI